MEESKSRSLTDVSRLKEVTEREHVDFKSPRDLSMVLSPKGQNWLPPERPGQEDPSSVDFTPRFHTKRKSRIPTLKGSSMTSEKRYSKTRPSNKAVQKKKQIFTSSSESDFNEGKSHFFNYLILYSPSLYVFVSNIPSLTPKNELLHSTNIVLLYTFRKKVFIPVGGGGGKKKKGVGV